MKENDFQFMIKYKKVKLNWEETISHYFVVIFLLIIPITFIPDIYRYYFTDYYTGFRSGPELLLFSLPWVILAILFCVIQTKRLRFKKYKVECTKEEFKEALNRTTKELEWNVRIRKSNFIKAYRPWNWTGSWGEMITIIYYNDELYLNSICDPNGLRPSIISYGWNNKNINTFIKNLNDTKAGIEQIIIDRDSMVIKEWTFKKTLIRFVFYPFSLALIYFAIFKLIPENKISLSVGAILIGFGYIYWDVQALLLNKRLKEKLKR